MPKRPLCVSLSENRNYFPIKGQWLQSISLNFFPNADFVEFIFFEKPILFKQKLFLGTTFVAHFIFMNQFGRRIMEYITYHETTASSIYSNHSACIFNLYSVISNSHCRYSLYTLIYRELLGHGCTESCSVTRHFLLKC